MIQDILLGIYLIVVPFAHASNFAYWQRKYKCIADEYYWDDWVFSIYAAIFWPVNLYWFVHIRFKYGLK